MSMREYRRWKNGALVSGIVWLIMVFNNTETVMSALIGGATGCFCFYYWIRILPASKNVHISYVISTFATIVINKFIDVQWIINILTSCIMMIAIMFGALYVCTKEILITRKDKKTVRIIDYRNNLRRLNYK